MPIRYVNPNASAGGDGTTNSTSGANAAFQSLSLAEAAITNPIGGAWEIICETGGNADTTRVTFTGSYTSTSTNYIYIHSSSGHKHNGVWDAAKYRLAPTSGSGASISVNEDYVKIEDLQIEAYAGDGINIDFLSSGSVKAYVNRCIIRWNNGTGMGIYARSGTSILTNNIIYDFAGNASAMGINARNAAATTYSYNNTIYGCHHGFGVSNSGVMTARNCVSFGNAGSDFSITAMHNCVSEDATAGSSNGCKHTQTLTSGVFANYSTRDFHLLSSDTILKDSGGDLSSDPDSLSDWTGFSDDINGSTRSGTWDIGADEYTSSGTSVFPTLSHLTGTGVLFDPTPLPVRNVTVTLNHPLGTGGLNSFTIIPQVNKVVSLGLVDGNGVLFQPIITGQVNALVMLTLVEGIGTLYPLNINPIPSIGGRRGKSTLSIGIGIGI